jgi:lysophospholipase L1-like esterase
MLKLLLFVAVPVVIVVGVVAVVYVAVVAGVDIPGLDKAFRATAEPPSPEVLARVQQIENRVEAAVSGKAGFYLELTDQDLTDLIRSRIGSDANVVGLSAKVSAPDEVKLSGQLNGRVKIPFSGTVGAKLDRGQVELEMRGANVTGMPLPGAAREQLQALADDVVDVNQVLRKAGATLIQALIIEEGKIGIVGVQETGEIVSPVTKNSVLTAAQSNRPPVGPPPGGNVVPPGTTGSKAGNELYLALGDSLAANVGIDDPRNGYVSRFHRYMEGKTARQLGLINLGISGESSLSIYKQGGQLERALTELRARKNDGNAATKVSVLTIDLGANDLLAHVNSPECGNAPRSTPCQARVTSALSTFEANFTDILAQLRAELEPGAEFYVMTAYNPFDLGWGISIEEFSNGIIDQLNAIIRRVGTAAGAKVADPAPLMKGKAGAWTLILQADIHPNPDGYQVLAYSYAQAREAQ